MSLIEWTIRRLTAKSAVSAVVFWACFGPVLAYVVFAIWGIANEAQPVWGRLALDFGSTAFGREIAAESIDFDADAGLIRISDLRVGDPSSPAGVPLIEGGLLEAEVLPLREAVAQATKAPAAIPKRVTLSGASVVIRRDADGTWNFKAGMKPGAPRAIEGLGFALIFRDCDIVYDDAVVKEAMRSEEPIRGTAAHGFLYFGESRAHLQVTATRPSGGELSVWCWFDYAEPNYAVRVSGADEDARIAQGLAKHIGIEGLSGSLDFDLEASKLSPAAPFYFDCTARLQGGSCRHPMLPEEVSSIQWDGRFDLAGVKGSGSGVVGDIPVGFSIDVTGYSEPRLEAQVRSDRLRLDALDSVIAGLVGGARPPELRVRDRGEVEATILWTQETGLGAYGTASVPAIEFGAYRAQDVGFGFNYASGCLAVTDVHLAALGGSASADAIVDFAPGGPQVSLVGEISGVDLSEVAQMMADFETSWAEPEALDLRGRCDALVSVQYTGRELRVASSAQVDGAILAGHRIARARIDAEYGGQGKIECSGFAEDSGGAAIWIDGCLDLDSGPDLDFALANYDLTNLGAFGVSEPVTGNAWMVGNLSGPFEDPLLSAECAVFDFGVRGFSVSGLRGGFDARPGGVALRQTTAFSGGGEASVSGHLSGIASEHPTVEFQAELDSVALDALRVGALDRAGASGRVSGRVAVKGSTGDPHVDIEVQVLGATVYSYPLGNVDVLAAYSGGELDIERLSAVFSTQVIEVSGRVRPGETLSITVDAADLRADQLAALADPLSGLTGTFDAHAEISGAIASPLAHVSFASTGLAFAGEPLGATVGTVSVEDGVVTAQDFISQLDDQSVRIDRVFYDSATGETEFVAEADQFRLATLINMARSPHGRSLLPAAVVKAATGLREGTQGVFWGKADIVSSAGALSGLIEVQGEDLALAHKPIGSLDAKISLDNGDLEIQRMVLSGDHGVLSALGTIDRSGSADIALAGRSIDLAYIGEWAAKGTPIAQGEASFDCRITGLPEDRRFEASLAAKDLQVSFVPLDSVECDEIIVGGKRLQVNDLIASGAANEIVINADLPFDPTELAIAPDQPLSLTATARLRAVESDILRHAGFGGLLGYLTGELAVSGTFSEPDLAGRFVISDATFSLPCMTRPAEHVTAEIDIADRVVTLKTLEATLGNGSVTARGTVQLDGLAPQTMAFTAELDHAAIGIDNASGWYGEEFDGELTGSIEATNVGADGARSPLLSPTVTGAIAVSNGTVTIPPPPVQERPPRAKPLFDPNFAIDVTSTEDIAVRLPNARIGARPEFSVRGSLSAPQVIGSVTASRGRLYYIGNRFKLTSGDVRLTYAPPVIIAAVSASAEITTPGAKIMIDISGAWGPFSNLSIDLSSSPPMSEPEILAALGHGRDIERLLSGRTLDAFLSDETWKLLASAFQPKLLMPFEDVLISALGLESVSIDLGFAGQSYVSLEKQIFRGLYVGYTKTLTGAEARETLRLFWRVNRYSEAYWSQDPDWGQRIGVTARWRF